MEGYTLKELRKIASEKKIRGRSKMNKAELCEALSGLTSQFNKMNLENHGSGIEKYLVGKMEKMSLEEEPPTQNPFAPKPHMRVHSFYDYVVVECPSTSEAFPVLVDYPEGGEETIKWNDFMYHFFGYTHHYEGVWVTTEFISGPIGLKANFNSPLSVHFERYTDKSGKKRLAYATVTPHVDPEIAGYKDILDKYGDYDEEQGTYHVSKATPFCKEIIERCEEWDYVPPFVGELERALGSRGIGFSNKIIFVDVECSDLEDLQEVVLDYPSYSDCYFNPCQRFETPEGLYVAYLKLE